MEPLAAHPESQNGSLARTCNLDPLNADCVMDFPVVTRIHRDDACRVLAHVGGGSPPRLWLGERQRLSYPFRVEAALQLGEPASEAGCTICFLPAPCEWGGPMMPPVVFFAFVHIGGISIHRLSEAGLEVVKAP